MSEVRVKAKVRPRPRDGERIRVRDRFRVWSGLVLLPTLVTVHMEVSVSLVTVLFQALNGNSELNGWVMDHTWVSFWLHRFKP